MWHQSFCHRRRQTPATSSSTAGRVIRRFSGRLPKDVPHAQPEASVQPGGPGGGAGQRLHHQDVSQPLQPGKRAAPALLNE